MCLSSIEGNNILQKWKRIFLQNSVIHHHHVNKTENFTKAEWFEQTLDHFNPTDDRTWKQRYFVNDSFYEPGGPDFIMIGGEAKSNPVWMVEPGLTWLNYAKKHKAIRFLLEHRFYGESHPTQDLNVTNLVYLTSDQALADLATFITGTHIAHVHCRGLVTDLSLIHI